MIWASKDSLNWNGPMGSNGLSTAPSAVDTTKEIGLYISRACGHQPFLQLPRYPSLAPLYSILLQHNSLAYVARVEPSASDSECTIFPQILLCQKLFDRLVDSMNLRKLQFVGSNQFPIRGMKQDLESHADLNMYIYIYIVYIYIYYDNIIWTYI